jgi:hypothetical protein
MEPLSAAGRRYPHPKHRGDGTAGTMSGAVTPVDRPGALRTHPVGTDWRKSRPLVLRQQAAQLGILNLEALELDLADL